MFYKIFLGFETDTEGFFEIVDLLLGRLLLCLAFLFSLLRYLLLGPASPAPGSYSPNSGTDGCTFAGIVIDDFIFDLRFSSKRIKYKNTGAILINVELMAVASFR
jgi:hypothetical protein